MFDSYSPQTLRTAIEIELQKTNDPKLAANLAIARLKKNPEYYDDFMVKAKDTSKLVKKVITNKRGKQQTVYVKVIKDEKKEGWVNKIAGLFGLKDRGAVMRKIADDYKNNEIDKKYNLTWDDWKGHVSEYFKNKKKWDDFFSGKKEKKDKKPGKKTEKKEKTAKKKLTSKDGIKLSVMRELHKIYGGVKEKPKKFELTLDPRSIAKDFDEKTQTVLNPMTNNRVKVSSLSKEYIEKYLPQLKEVGGKYVDTTTQKDNFDTMPEAEEPERKSNWEYFEDAAVEIKNKILKKNPTINEQILDRQVINELKKRRNNTKPGDIKDDFSRFVESKEAEYDKKYGEPEDVEPVKEPEKIADEEPEKEKEETKEEKKEDKKIAKKINKATPENRNKTEREIVGIPDPPPEEDIVTPAIEFSPKETTITIPDYKGGGPKSFPAKDYTGVIPKDIYLVSNKKILTEDRPKYIPEVNEDYFESTKYFLPTIKVSEDKYIVKTNSKVTRFTKPESGVIDKEEYTIVSRDVLAAMQDYYMKKAKEKQKEYHKALEEKHGRKYRKTRVSMITERKMTYEQSNLLRSFGIGPHSSSFTESRQILWDKYNEIRNDMKQKMSDMEIQLEEHYNTHAKGRETAYGDKGLKDNLLEDYGVKVKRQNGAEINNTEIGEIKLALDDMFSVFGNRSSMARNSDLKISHSGDKLMHARKAAGLYMPAIKAIGITTKYGQEGTGFILAHEWSHFMDHYLGDKKGRHYVSDDPENIASEIADTFRKNMTKKQKSAYQNRTCECFARAMEQYWAIKTDNKETVSSWDTGNHPTEEVFTERIMPLIDQFFQENDKLLKAIFKIGSKFFRKVK